LFDRASRLSFLIVSVFAATVILAGQQADDAWRDLFTQGQRFVVANDPGKAELALEKALHEAERFGHDDWRAGATLESLGQVYRIERKFGDAEGVWRRAQAIFARANGDDSVEVANVNFELGQMMLEIGHSTDAIVLARKTLTVYEKTFGGTNPKTAAVACLIGDSLRTMRNFSDAEAPLRRCADIREAASGIDSVDLADALHSLALTYAGERKYAQAEERFKLVEKIQEKTLGLTSPLLAQTMEDHAALLRSAGREKEAQRLTVLSAAIRRNEKRDGVRYPENKR
jgi:tetratricopeptide (TPR) repeat protein